MEKEPLEPLGSENSVAQEDGINLRHYWHVILERRWLIIAAFVSVLILSLIFLFKATPIYQATAKMQIDPESENILRIEGLSVGRQEQDYLQTQYKNLLSRTLIQSVVTKLKLQEDERYAQSATSGDIIRSVAGDIQIVPIRLSRLVEVKVEHPDPKQAQRIANNLVTNFIDLNRDQKVNAALYVVKRLEDEAEAQKKKLEDAEKEIQRYVERYKKVSFEEGDNIASQALKQSQSEYTLAQSRAESAQKIVDAVDATLELDASIYTIPQVANNSAIQDLRKQLAILESEFAELKKKYKSRHPAYVQAEEKVLSLQSSMTNQALTLVQSLRVAARTAKKEEESLLEMKDRQERDLIELNSLKIDYGVLKRQAKQNDGLYQQVLAKMKETELSGRNKIDNMRVVDEANIPLRPIKPRVMLTIFLGFVGGIAVALGLAFFVNYLDDSIKSQDDVETYLRLPFLGYVPNIKTNSVVERDMQSHLHPQSNAAEGFRTIRATISLTHKPEKFRILAVTSTIPSEGKSLVASNLSIVTAQTGLKTLLIDADLRRPSVHKAYQLHSPTGLASYLMDEVRQIDDIVHKTEVPNLDVICCGSVPSTPSELIGSKRMMEFLKDVRGRYDRVILDCPPISAVSDPLIISAMSDGIVFVTKFNKIRREHARKSVQRVQNAGIHILGVVLNDIDFEGKDSYYYSYYYYQNRYYSSHYRTADGRAKEKPEESTQNSDNN
jgi:succinoglycan biosynthesis transport protein ExoP